MNALLSSLQFSAGVALPNILMLLLGALLRKHQFIDERFCDQASKIVFHITLPMLLFLGISGNSIDFNAQALLITAGIIGTLILYFGGELLATKFIANKKERGIFVQALFRGNAGIIGLSLCANAYGAQGVAAAAVYVAFIVLLYNVLSVFTLTRSLAENSKTGLFDILKTLIKNPLIIAISLALVANVVQFSLPKTLNTTATYLANITLPLALLCAGASINLRGLDNSSALSLWSSFARVVTAPLILVIIGKFFGLQGMELGILFLITATPLASAAYPMVRGMGGNASLVANIMGLSTIGSMIMAAVGLVILKQMGWI